MFPVRLFPPSRNTSRFSSPPISGGMLPVKPFSRRSSTCKSVSPPSSGGMLPVRPFQPRCSTCRSVSPLSSGGMLPVRPFLWSSKRKMRGGDPSIAMPTHPPIGVLAPQFSVAPPARTSRAASSVAQSSTSSGWRSGSATAPHVACGFGHSAAVVGGASSEAYTARPSTSATRTASERTEAMPRNIHGEGRATAAPPSRPGDPSAAASGPRYALRLGAWSIRM